MQSSALSGPDESTFRRVLTWSVTWSLTWSVGDQFSVFSFQFSVFSFWILDFGFWILDFGFWILDFGFWILRRRRRERCPRSRGFAPTSILVATGLLRFLPSCDGLCFVGQGLWDKGRNALATGKRAHSLTSCLRGPKGVRVIKGAGEERFDLVDRFGANHFSKPTYSLPPPLFLPQNALHRSAQVGGFGIHLPHRLDLAAHGATGIPGRIEVVFGDGRGVVGVDIHLRGGGDGVLSGGEKEKFPAVFFLPFLNLRSDVLPGEFAGGVFVAVGEDREDDLVGALVFGQGFDALPEGLDRFADGVEERGRPPWRVGPGVDRTNFANGKVVDRELVAVIKEDQADFGKAFDLLLFTEEIVEPGDGSFGELIHRPRHVEDVGDFGGGWGGGFRAHELHDN